MKRSQIPNLADVVRQIFDEVEALDGAENQMSAPPDSIQQDPEGVLEAIREESGLNLPDAWAPLCLEDDVCLRWKPTAPPNSETASEDRRLPGHTAMSVLWEPTLYTAPFIDDENGTTLGDGDWAFSDAGGVNVVFRVPDGATTPDLWVKVPTAHRGASTNHRHVLPIDVDLPRYVAALRLTRGTFQWPLFFAPLERNDERFESLSRIIDTVESLFGEDIREPLAELSPNAAANVARVDELRQKDEWPEQARVLCEQPVLVMQVTDSPIADAMKDLDLPDDAAVYFMAPAVESFKRFDELDERPTESAPDVVSAAVEWAASGNLTSSYENNEKLFGRGAGHIEWLAGFHNLPESQIREAFVSWGYRVYTADAFFG